MKEKNGFIGDKTTASSLIMMLFIDCEIAHAYVCLGVG